MWTVWLTDHVGRHRISDHDSLDAAVRESRKGWNEEGGPQTFLVTEQSPDQKIVAVLLRLDEDPELCRTLHTDGRVETHRCHDVLGEDGFYDHTEVSQVHDIPPHWLV